MLSNSDKVISFEEIIPLEMIDSMILMKTY